MAKAKQQVKESKPSYMTTYEAADFLGFTAGTLRVWRSQGKGPNYYKVGSTVRYEMDDLEALLMEFGLEEEVEADAIGKKATA